MQKFKLSRIIDRVFTYIVTLLISFAWLQFYISNLLIVISLAIGISVIFSAIIFSISDMRNSKSKTKKNNEKDIDECALHMHLMSSASRNLFMKKLAPAKNCRIEKGKVIFTIGDKKFGLAYFQKHAIVNDYNICEYISEWKNICEKLIIICDGYDSTAINMSTSISGFEIVLLDKTSAYCTLYAPHMVFPDSKVVLQKKSKLHFHDFINIVFEKRKAKRYFFSGIILLFASIIIPYNVYYILIATLLLVMCLTCLILPKTKRVVKSAIWN